MDLHRSAGALKTAATPWALLTVLLVVACLTRDSGSAVAFTMPALTACALSGRMFATALMVMTSTVAMLALPVGVGASAPPAPVSTTTQIALALLALGPLVVAAATAERRRGLAHSPGRFAGVRKTAPAPISVPTAAP